MAAKTPQSGSLVTSGSTTITCDGQDMADLHCLTVQGSGVVTVSLKHLGQSTFTQYATGFTADTDTFLMKGCTGVKLVENGTGSLTYSYIAYD